MKLGKSILTALIATLGKDLVCGASTNDLRLFLVPKYDSSFFLPCWKGCEDRAAELALETGRNITCTYSIPKQKFVGDVGTGVQDNAAVQAEHIFDLLQQGEMDAIAISALDPVTIAPMIDRVVDAGIPVVMFDSDAPLSKRAAYIGTDNYSFGRQLARIAQTLVPEGGTYATFFSSESDNLVQRANGIRDEMERKPEWIPHRLGPYDTKGETDILSGFYKVSDVDDPPTVIISTRFGYMNQVPGWVDYMKKYKSKNIRQVSADASDLQLEYLSSGYADGLLAQLPYEFGTQSVDALVALSEGLELRTDNIATDMVSHVKTPATLDATSATTKVNSAWVSFGFLLGLGLALN